MTLGKFHRGNKASAHLTPEAVWEMRQRYSQGWTQGALAREYKISVGHVGRIVRGEVWHEYDNPAQSIVEPQASARPPSDDEIRASEQRLAALIANNLPKASVDKQLDQFINPRAKARYYGEQASEQQTSQSDSEGHPGALGTEATSPGQGPGQTDQGLRGSPDSGAEKVAVPDAQQDYCQREGSDPDTGATDSLHRSGQ